VKNYYGTEKKANGPEWAGRDIEKKKIDHDCLILASQDSVVIIHMFQRQNDYNGSKVQEFIFPICLRVSYIRKEYIGKAVPVLNTALNHRDISGSGGIDPPFVTSTLDGGELPASRFGTFSPRGEKAPNTYWLGGCVGPRSGVDAVD
jgi:hypothetical protein